MHRDNALDLISGRDGRLRHSFVGTSLDSPSEPVGDLDGDGASDIVVTDNTRFSVYSGASLQVLRTVQAGPSSMYAPVSVAGIGDVDGDATPDLLAMTDTGTYDVVLTTYSGRTGAVLSAMRHLASWQRSRTAHALGDVDGDGVRDWVALFIGLSGLGARNDVFSARTQTVLFSSPPASAPFIASDRASDAGDVDGDGRDDVLFPLYHPFSPSRVELEGIRGTIHVWPLRRNGAGAGDVDGDGVPDVVIVTGAPITGAPALEFYSGSTFARLSTEPVPLVYPVVSRLADIDGDGGLELALGGGEARTSVAHASSCAALRRSTSPPT